MKCLLSLDLLCFYSVYRQIDRYMNYEIKIIFLIPNILDFKGFSDVPLLILTRVSEKTSHSKKKKKKERKMNHLSKKNNLEMDTISIPHIQCVCIWNVCHANQTLPNFFLILTAIFSSTKVFNKKVVLKNLVQFLRKHLVWRVYCEQFPVLIFL